MYVSVCVIVCVRVQVCDTHTHTHKTNKKINGTKMENGTEH